MKKIVIFASGGGSNAQAIINHFAESATVAITKVYCNKQEAGVLGIAAKANIPTIVFTKQEMESGLVEASLATEMPDLIVLAGFLLKIPSAIVQRFSGKIVNIHPALLPKYGGKGMHGMHVHEAVVAAKEEFSGITIHYVNEHYDEGAPLLQSTYKLVKEETAHSLAANVLKLEHFYFPRVIEFLMR